MSTEDYWQKMETWIQILVLGPQAPYFSVRGEKEPFCRCKLTSPLVFPKSHFRYSTQYLPIHFEVFTPSWILCGLVCVTNKGCFPTTLASKGFEQCQSRITFYWRVFWGFHCNCSCSKPCSTSSAVGTGNISTDFLVLCPFPKLNWDWFFASFISPPQFSRF